ncbi:MAG TPA: hypothetical protein VLE54_05140, partial [Thermoanaerobaculia bacterium]|nr:hypothetical protein [Thermoanaerobaculia bacterium]
ASESAAKFAPAEPVRRPKRRTLPIAVGISLVAVLLGLGGLWVSRRARPAPPEPTRWEQVTKFTDSATSPALSPDGRMVAFIRGLDTFISPGEIYVKQLPDGEPVRLTDDGLGKMSPIFSPDGSRIAYTREPWPWDTWIVPVLAGKPSRWLPNSSGLTWIDREHILFSEVKKGFQMALVTSAESRADQRDVYVPQTDQGMAHRSYLSPDRKWVLIAEMDISSWLPCRLMPFDASSKGRTVGPPNGRCTSGAWTPDGRWMYLTVDVGDGFHIWRQSFPDGKPEQVTSGATEEDGIAMAPDGHSFLTSVGTVQSSVWMHDERGERQLTSEGYSTFGRLGNPRSNFSADGRKLYYLVRQEGTREFVDGELWVLDLESNRRERLLPGLIVAQFDHSANGTRVVFAVRGADGTSQLWLASLERRFSPRRISSSRVNELRPVYASSGDVFFNAVESGGRALYRMKEDGTGRQRLLPQFANTSLYSASPDGGWIAFLSLRAAEDDPNGRLPLEAHPVDGGSPVRICLGCRNAKWAPDGRFFYISYTSMGPMYELGRTYALPIPAGKPLPALPASGLKSEEEAAALPGVTFIPHGNISPGRDPSVYAFTNITAQRNLYRIPIAD